MKTLFIDCETFSEIDLKKCGAYRYAENAEILMVSWAWDDDPVDVWDLTDDYGPTLDDVRNMIEYADRIVIHNSPFERAVSKGNGIHIPVEKIEDTMVMALAHGLPGKLEQLGPALHLPLDKEKDKAGKKLIQLFTKPRPKNMKLRRATRGTHPDEWAQFIEYARQDVVAMRDVYRRIPRWNCSDSERALWLLDQDTADRGIRIDLDLARSALRAFEGASRTLAARTAALTGGAIRSATQTQALRAYILERYGYDMPDMTGDTVDWFLAGENLHPEARELLTIRAQSAATTPSKYRALLEATCSDGRLRGVLQFAGAARTGRDCLAEGTPILVRDVSGAVYEKPIETVELSDMVWDGDSWVRHEGVVFSGDKPVIEHDGIVATAEHVVYLSDTEHVSLGEAATRGLRLWRGNT